MKMVNLVLYLALLLGSIEARAFREEVVTVRGYGGVSLKGQWMLPDGEIRAIALVLPGQGNVGLDGDVSGPVHGRPFSGTHARISRQIAETLASSGVASLRYDKRGFGEAGELTNQRLSVLAKDAAAAAQQARLRYPTKRLAIAGFDEGARIATLVALEQNVDALFLFGLSTRSVDEVLRYQYFEWPVELLRSRIHVASSGELALDELKARGIAKPLFSETLSVLDRPIAEFDIDRNGSLSIDHELRPAYAAALNQIMALMQSSQNSVWYIDQKSVPALKEYADRLSVPITYIYQGLDDAQVNPRWYHEDLRLFQGIVMMRPYVGLGHCFSPMVGSIGQVRTSGPLRENVLADLARDARRF